MSSSSSRSAKVENSFLLRYLDTIKDLPNDTRRQLCVLRVMDLKLKQKMWHASALSKEIYQLSSASAVDPSPPAQEVYTPIDQDSRPSDNVGDYTNDDECLSSDASLLISDNSLSLPPCPVDPDSERKIKELRDKARNDLLEARVISQEKVRLVESICKTLQIARESLDKIMIKFHNFLHDGAMDNCYSNYFMNAAAVNGEDEDDRVNLNDDDDIDDADSDDSTPSVSATPNILVSPSPGLLKRSVNSLQSGLSRQTPIANKRNKLSDVGTLCTANDDADDDDDDEFESDMSSTSNEVSGDDDSSDGDNVDNEENYSGHSTFTKAEIHKTKPHSHNTRYRSASSTPSLTSLDSQQTKAARNTKPQSHPSNKSHLSSIAKKAVAVATADESAAASADDTKETYCICGKPSEGDMICCDDPECEIQWYHFECVGIKEPPKGIWICDKCKEKKKKQPQVDKKA